MSQLSQLEMDLALSGESSEESLSSPANHEQLGNPGQIGEAPENLGQLGEAPENQGQLGEAPGNPGQIGEAPGNPEQLGEAPENLGQHVEAPENPGQLGEAPENLGQHVEAPENPGQIGEAPENLGQHVEAPENPGQLGEAPGNPGQIGEAPENPGQLGEAPDDEDGNPMASNDSEEDEHEDSESDVSSEEETDIDILKNKIKDLKKTVRKQQKKIDEFEKKEEKTKALYQTIQLIKKEEEFMAQKKKRINHLRSVASEGMEATFNLPPEETRKLLQNKRGRKRKILPTDTVNAEEFGESSSQKKAKGIDNAGSLALQKLLNEEYYPWLNSNRDEPARHIFGLPFIKFIFNKHPDECKQYKNTHSDLKYYFHRNRQRTVERFNIYCNENELPDYPFGDSMDKEKI